MEDEKKEHPTTSKDRKDSKERFSVDSYMTSLNFPTSVSSSVIDRIEKLEMSVMEGNHSISEMLEVLEKLSSQWIKGGDALSKIKKENMELKTKVVTIQNMLSEIRKSFHNKNVTFHYENDKNIDLNIKQNLDPNQIVVKNKKNISKQIICSHFKKCKKSTVYPMAFKKTRKHIKKKRKHIKNSYITLCLTLCLLYYFFYFVQDILKDKRQTLCKKVKVDVEENGPVKVIKENRKLASEVNRNVDTNRYHKYRHKTCSCNPSTRKMVVIFIMLVFILLITMKTMVVAYQSPYVPSDKYSELLKDTAKREIMYYQPEQIHLSFGESVSDIVVTWSTFNDTPKSVVEYGINGLEMSAEGYSKKFVDGGPEKHFQFIHRVTLTNLLPKKKYVYHCGSMLGWSSEFSFNTVENAMNWSPRLAVYGDLGNINAKSLPYLQEDSVRNLYDAILHVGDFAYDMRDNNGRVGDQFMRQIEPIAAYLPYMVSPGNHEEHFNFSHFRERFSMPGKAESLYYSFDLGPAHFISLNTEAYYFVEYGIKMAIKQYLWLVEDLRKANLPENRAKHPWIITYGHRPMYCSDDDGDDCTRHSSRVRSGFPIFNWYGLEDLFYENGVDLEIWAHEHSYERLWPVYNHRVLNGSNSEPYTNPRAPVHVISGSAGCVEFTDKFIKNPQSWSAFRTSDYGFARLQIFNSTHLHMDQVSVDQNGDVIDSFWIIKDKHGPYH